MQVHASNLLLVSACLQEYCCLLQAVIRNVREQCKCHGMSGSCELETCWKATPDFRKVGDVLRRKFDEASKVQVKRMFIFTCVMSLQLCIIQVNKVVVVLVFWFIFHNLGGL